MTSNKEKACIPEGFKPGSPGKYVHVPTNTPPGTGCPLPSPLNKIESRSHVPGLSGGLVLCYVGVTTIAMSHERAGFGLYPKPKICSLNILWKNLLK